MQPYRPPNLIYKIKWWTELNSVAVLCLPLVYKITEKKPQHKLLHQPSLSLKLYLIVRQCECFSFLFFLYLSFLFPYFLSSSSLYFFFLCFSFSSFSCLFLSLFFVSTPLSFSPSIYFFLSYPQIFIELFCARHGAPRSGVLASAPELCWFLPPLKAVGIRFQQFPGEQGGRRHGAVRVRKDSPAGRGRWYSIITLGMRQKRTVSAPESPFWHSFHLE